MWGELQAGLICLDDRPDSLCWTYDTATGMLSAKLAYQQSMNPYNNIREWWHMIWKWKLPLQISICVWLALENRLLSWDNLMWRGQNGPGMCMLCGTSNENIHHLFVTCGFFTAIWNIIAGMIKVYSPWSGDSLSSCFRSLWKNHQHLRNLPCFIIWTTWGYRNKVIFEGSQ